MNQNDLIKFNREGITEKKKEKESNFLKNKKYTKRYFILEKAIQEQSKLLTEILTRGNPQIF